MAHLALDEKMVDRCRQMAARIAKPVEQMINTHTTVAIERAVLRLLGVEGAVKQGGQWFPEVNVIVEDLRREKALGDGVLYWFVNGMIQKRMPARELAAAVAARKIQLLKLPRAADDAVRNKATELCKEARQNLLTQR